MITFPLRGQFWTGAAVAGLSLWASGAPSAIYPHYASEWNLPTATTSAIFAIYPLVLVPVLLLFGGLSDFIGRRASILIGISALTLGALSLALAPDVAWVFVGRALMGLGVGLSLSPATAAMVDAGGPDGAARASSATTASTATGLALATLVSGAMLQYLPDPLHLSYWVLVVLSAITAALVWFMPRNTVDAARGRWRPSPLRVPAGLRTGFASAALAVSGAYSIGAIFLALGAQVAKDLVHSDSDLANGAVLSVSAVAIGVTALIARRGRLRPRISIAAGAVVAVIGLLLFIAAGLVLSLPLFLLASAIGGVGYSLLFAGGLGVLTAAAPVRHRASVLSSAYTIAYLTQATVAFGLGAIATKASLPLAVDIGTAIVAAIGAAAALVALAHRAPPAPAA
ncbi:MFS transporter [Amnibacterium flavum]|uniref:MFS transporter n=1 Tax=Amnibacterium flavum TaxID=2173173 RepID=A0A2V1HWC1_9MICO|nr:MFS transporter [Amnibacterium flavum]PVZ95420.1 MFS transporter [Amnibacterium flavum]